MDILFPIVLAYLLVGVMFASYMVTNHPYFDTVKRIILGLITISICWPYMFYGSAIRLINRIKGDQK